jgi:protein-disulfide isomerase
MTMTILSRLTRNLRQGAFAVALSALTIGAIPSPTLAFDDSQKAEIGTIVRDYLLANPEIIAEVQQALEEKRDTEAKEKARVALRDNASMIFASTNQFEIGPPDADVVVVEFFDYNCGFCQRAMTDMNRLLETDKNLKFVLKEIPILSEQSVEAHRVSIAFGRLMPEKYAEFHRLLLGARGIKDGARALQVAKELGADTAKLRKMANEESVNDAFREANALANQLGMTGTPSYVIGDEVVFGALGYDVLKEKIDNVRKCKSATC